MAIMDADKAGFLRSRTSMIQQMGRAARNVNSRVLLYADAVTPAMAEAMEETERRREIQLAYNKEHGITPETVTKSIRMGLEYELRAHKTAQAAIHADDDEYEVTELITMLEGEMLEAAKGLEFEKAAGLRDRIEKLKAEPAGKKVMRGSGGGEEKKAKPGEPGTRVVRKKKGKKGKR